MMNTRVEMNEEMMEKVNGGFNPFEWLCEGGKKIAEKLDEVTDDIKKKLS